MIRQMLPCLNDFSQISSSRSSPVSVKLQGTFSEINEVSLQIDTLIFISQIPDVIISGQISNDI